MSVVATGEPAPPFTLRREDGSEFTEGDLRGQTTVLVFYPFAFSPVCTDQLSLYQARREEFAARDAVLAGVSCDASPSQTAFREHLGVTIPQLSDFEPKGATCRAFGVLHPGGFAERALVIVRPDGTVGWTHVADSPGDLPSADLVLDGLTAATG